jgi:hypothetical protein
MGDSLRPEGIHVQRNGNQRRFGGLDTCGATFRYIVPLPNIFLTRLFSKRRFKKEGLPRDSTPDLAQEVPSSNLGAPTKTSRVFSLAY